MEVGGFLSGVERAGNGGLRTASPTLTERIRSVGVASVGWKFEAVRTVGRTTGPPYGKCVGWICDPTVLDD